jgi:hypothetical protein
MKKVDVFYFIVFILFIALQGYAEDVETHKFGFEDGMGSWTGTGDVSNYEDYFNHSGAYGLAVTSGWGSSTGWRAGYAEWELPYPVSGDDMLYISFWHQYSGLKVEIIYSDNTIQTYNFNSTPWAVWVYRTIDLRMLDPDKSIVKIRFNRDYQSGTLTAVDDITISYKMKIVENNFNFDFGATLQWTGTGKVSNYQDYFNHSGEYGLAVTSGWGSLTGWRAGYAEWELPYPVAGANIFEISFWHQYSRFKVEIIYSDSTIQTFNFGSTPWATWIQRTIDVSMLAQDKKIVKIRFNRDYAGGTLTAVDDISISYWGTPHRTPVGGGYGYNYIINREEADYIIEYVDDGIIDYVSDDVKSLALSEQLLNALHDASTGDIIYIDDDAEIDLTFYFMDDRPPDEQTIVIPAGVTLASGRGKMDSSGNISKGALIYVTEEFGETDDFANRKTLFKTGGDKVRFTGLRLAGPYEWYGNDSSPMAHGLHVEDSDNCIIDNCEFYYWPNSAVSLEDSLNLKVYNNYFHHNHRYRLGYGVELIEKNTEPDKLGKDETVIIQANLFSKNRHAIAGTGQGNQSYEACYNIVMPGAERHNFDMHGIANKDGGSDIAGKFIYIHHNSFLEWDIWKAAVIIRGNPTIGCYIRDNSLFRYNDNGPSPFVQEDGASRFHVGTNYYGKYWWLVSYSGQSGWMPAIQTNSTKDEIKISDFNGDGKDDFFKADGSNWYVLYNGTTGWQEINNSSYTINNLAFGDFNNDNITDVFRANGNYWYVRYSGREGWQKINRSSYTVNNLGFGDFVGDGKTDVFRTDIGKWYVSESGSNPWQQLNRSNYTVNNLAFGDFVGDGKTDVFRTDIGKWYVSESGNNPWQQINRSDYTIHDIAFGDFVGDGKTDVFRTDIGKWYVSESGSSAWQKINTSDFTLDSLAFGDFNGDGKTDVFRVYGSDRY